MNKQDHSLTRRNFLKLLLTSGAAVTLSPLLKACNATPTPMPTSTTLPYTPTSTVTPTVTPTGTATPTATATPDPAAKLLEGLAGLPIDTFFDESLKRWLLRDPESLTIAGISGLYGIGNDQLTDISDEYIRQTQKLQSGILNLLRAYDRSTFTPAQVLTADIYEWQLDDMVRGHAFMYYDYPVTPMRFVYSVTFSIYQLFTEAQPVNSLLDAQAYITRLSQVGTKFEQLLDGLKRREALGIILPRQIIPEVIDELAGVATSRASATFFFTTLADKLNQVNSLNAADRQSLLDQAEQIITDGIIPAYQKLADYFTYLEPFAPQGLGLWQFPQGLEYYQYLLRHYTTTELAADEIYELGLQNVERIKAEIRLEFDKLGYPSGESVEVSINRLVEESGTVSGNQAVAAWQTAIDRGRGMLDQVCNFKLDADVIVVGGELGNFLAPAPLDGSRPAYFYAVTTGEIEKYSIPDIAFHETYPGHFVQTTIARELDLPLVRRIQQFIAYEEGWGLYAERLVWELGAYTDDPYGNLGRLDLELLRAVRLVVDTGIHTRQWTFDQAAQYMTGVLGYYTELKRYTSIPGQATGYYIGFLKMLELRQKANDTLGSKFDIKEFHDTVLGSGEVPLAILEPLVEAYIAQKSA
jgi:uncharacterized protein (DUF885 family)